MHSQMYGDERRRSSARDEMEVMMAAEDDHRQQMGCSPLGRIISRVFNCKGRQVRMRRSERMDYGAMAYPPAQTCYVRPTARTVTFTTANAHAMPPKPLQAHAVAMPGAQYSAAPPQGGGGGGGGNKPRKKKKSKSKRVRFAPAGAPLPTDAPPPHAHHHTAAAAAVTGGQFHDQHPSAAAEPYSSAAAHGHGHGYRRYAYTPSPLARWEMLGAAGTPRRHEYFSGEYRWYYPTPVREGIYSLATDANRLTTIFSEENPNACAIV